MENLIFCAVNVLISNIFENGLITMIYEESSLCLATYKNENFQ